MNGSYRLGFNGKENDNEVKGEGNQQDYGSRIYDPRINRFLSLDPLTSEYPELSPYQFASNSPIGAVDLDGGEMLPVNSAMYRHKYLGSTEYLELGTNKTTCVERYDVMILYHNIPKALQDPEHQDFKFTSGGPVTANGRDYDPAIDGEIIYRTGRYFNRGPGFIGSISDNRSPSPTASTEGLYSFEPDQVNNSSRGANSAASARTRSVANAGSEAAGLISNQLNTAIWKASAKESDHRRAYYNSTLWTKAFIDAGKLVNFSQLASGKGKADLINFMLDGTMTTGSGDYNSLTVQQIQYDLDLIKVGVHFLKHIKSKGESISIQKEISSTFNKLLEAYQSKGGDSNSYNDVTFD